MGDGSHNKIKLLQLCLSRDLGGLELYVLNAAQALQSDFDIRLLLNNQGKLHDQAAKKGLEFDTLGSKKKYSLLTLLQLKKYILDNGIEIVHVHWAKDLPLVAAAKFLSKKKFKIAYTRHIPLKSPKKDFYHRWLYRQVDLIIAITDRIKDELYDHLHLITATRVERVYLSTEAHKIPAAEEIKKIKNSLFHRGEDPFVIGVFARIEPLKGQLDVLRAVERLLKNGCDCRLVFVGNVLDEAYNRALQSYIEEHDLGDRVTFTGFIDDPKPLMAACDAVVLASRFEAFGLVLIEAMQMGTAVVASDVGGIPEIIEDGVNGLMFEYSDNEVLQTLLLKLCNDEDLRRAIGGAGIETVKRKFSNTAHYQRLVAILSSLIEGK